MHGPLAPPLATLLPSPEGSSSISLPGNRAHMCHHASCLSLASLTSFALLEVTFAGIWVHRTQLPFPEGGINLTTGICFFGARGYPTVCWLDANLLKCSHLSSRESICFSGHSPFFQHHWPHPPHHTQTAQPQIQAWLPLRADRLQVVFTKGEWELLLFKGREKYEGKHQHNLLPFLPPPQSHRVPEVWSPPLWRFYLHFLDPFLCPTHHSLPQVCFSIPIPSLKISSWPDNGVSSLLSKTLLICPRPPCFSSKIGQHFLFRKCQQFQLLYVYNWGLSMSILCCDILSVMGL